MLPSGCGHKKYRRLTSAVLAAVSRSSSDSRCRRLERTGCPASSRSSRLLGMSLLSQRRQYISPSDCSAVCHLDRPQRSEATQCEWRDPENAYTTMLMQGISTRTLSLTPSVLESAAPTV